MDPNSPREVDQALAAQWRNMARLYQKMDSLTSTAQYVYGDRNVRHARIKYTTTAAQVWERVATVATTDDAYQVHIGQRPSEFRARYEKVCTELKEVRDRIEELEDLYTGWSRFFLVTSSAGHIHSSRSCHTCYDTTTYGWRPDLSGKSEAEAVAVLGPALCSTCFPSVRIDHQGKKVTKAQALRLAA